MVSDLIEQVRQGSRRAVARLITQVENEGPLAQAAVTALYPATGRAHVVGVTGAPGSGKSTLVTELAKALRKEQLSVGIVAVDPTSPFSGGALLGDRVRMRDLAGDEGVFIRSMASRGSLGGLARTTAAVIKVLDAAGFDVILVETVGAGQVEVDIARTAHTTLVIEAPGMGDDIQTIKAGILEIADILVVNKMDRPGAAQTVKSLKMMLHLAPTPAEIRHHGRQAQAGGPAQASGLRHRAGWEIPVLEATATEGKGMIEIVIALREHRNYLQSSGEWLAREKERSQREVEQLLQAAWMARWQAAVPPAAREQTMEAVARRELDPYTAAARLMEQVKCDWSNYDDTWLR
ncbi:MAG: methylmalonyl Co-A mutase-associated GTPase MeaB [Chloroflexota bacterium]